MFLHIDIDSFFVSAERTRNPKLCNRPVAVGGRSNLEIFNKKRTNIRLMNENSGAFVTPVFYSDFQKSFENFFVDQIDGRRKVRGIVTTSSYEARAHGVKTAMPIAQALRLCPELIVVPSNYLLYHRLSHQIYEFITTKIPLVEQYSIDEFFGDLRGWVKHDDCISFARKLQKEIQREFSIPVSIGIAQAKWTAKLATEFAKPYGVRQVDDVEAFVQEIPIAEFPGVGRGFQKRLHASGIMTLGDAIKNRWLFAKWKKPGMQLYHRIAGTDNEGIDPGQPRKSVGISRTFDPLADPDEVRRRIMIMARHICYIVMGIDVTPTRYYLKINYEYGVRARQGRRVERIFSEQLFKSVLAEMYEEIAHKEQAAVKLTLSVSDFTSHSHRTLSLLDLEEDQKNQRITQKMQSARQRFGLDAVRTANEL